MIPYGIRGVLWDQGESYTGIRDVSQFSLMDALIRSWREEWEQGDFPERCGARAPQGEIWHDRRSNQRKR